MVVLFYSDFYIFYFSTLRNFMELDNATLKRLKGIGHELKPIVMIGNNGVTPAIKDERDAVTTELAKNAKAQVIHTIGRMALLLRQNPNANPKLSNLSRHA